MSKAFVLLNCDIGTEPEIIDEINKIPTVYEAVRVSGIYDIVAKINGESKENIAMSIKRIRGIENVRSSLTMVVVEESLKHPVVSA